MKVTNKTILVTGANRGLGKALLEEALRRGAKKVYATTRGPFKHADPRVTALTLDQTDEIQIRQAANEVSDLDLLVNNAGVAHSAELIDVGVIQEHLDVNLLGPFRVTRAFSPLLKRSKGAILNILSLAAIAPVPIFAAYSISKAASHSMTQLFRAYLATHGVAVHAAFLGPVDTDMVRDIPMDKASPASVAAGIFDGLERGEEDIFPDSMAQALAEGWRRGIVKAVESQNAKYMPPETPGKDESFTRTFSVEQSPKEVFEAINDVRSWWTGDIEGSSGKLGDEFTYRYKHLHRSTQKLVEIVPDKKVVWRVSNAHLSFTKTPAEWNDTQVVFEIARKGDATEVRFTHRGLVPTFECFDACSGGWTHYIGSLKKRITTGLAQKE
ncbi:MAG: SDR family NAD(P)-dependent oxidoreductase [Polyangiaceae bacterium]|nr:SDR family NAD(P)-dependent oxidoreductase [Polyangiaceae bacterium]